jgi:hypothetical protein
LVISDDSFGNGLSDGVDLCNVTGTTYTHTDVKILEFLETEEQYQLLYFNAKGGGLENGDRGTIDTEDTFTSSHTCDGDCIFLFSKGLDELGTGSSGVSDHWLFFIDYYYNI